LRPARRAALRRARLAEWREGVWLRPDNVDVDESPHCEWLHAQPDGDPVALAARLFAPARWSGEAVRLVDALETATTRLRDDAERALAPAVLAGAAALRHVRADPLLPDELVPQPWPGAALRDAYVTYQREFASVARGWFAGQSS
jgi:phenylacetic acid degradation operon negative regulatory protein